MYIVKCILKCIYMREFLNQFSPVVWPAIVNINIYTNQIYIQVDFKKPEIIDVFDKMFKNLVLSGF